MRRWFNIRVEESPSPQSWPFTFWFKPDSFFGLWRNDNALTTIQFIFTLPFDSSPRPFEANSHDCFSRINRRLLVGTLSQKLRTWSLPIKHVLVEYEWRNIRLNPIKIGLIDTYATFHVALESRKKRVFRAFGATCRLCDSLRFFENQLI